MMSRIHMPDVIRVWMLRSCMMVLCEGGRETETWHGGLDSPESSIGSWNASKTAYAFKKFMVESIPPSGSSVKPENPWIFFRLAEFYLNYAEIMYELGNEEQAREYVNKVRAVKV